MSFRFPIHLIAGSLVVLVVCASWGTEQHYSPEELEAAKAELRTHIRLWTFEAGDILGREWTSRAPEDAELRALYARQLYGQLHGKREIQEQADAILEREPDNPWGFYAQALAFLADRNYSEAAAPSLRAWKLLPRPEFAATHLQALCSKSVEAGIAFLDSLDAATRQHPEVLHARAELEYWAQYSLEDPTYADTSLATLATLRARWPDHVSGYSRAAEQLYRSNKPQEALPLIEEAIRLSPGSAEVRYWHWNDKSRDVIDRFMAKNEYDFTVLMGAEYFQKAGVYARPTTWFVDGDGYIQFERGATSDLEEEFAWRVEALRGAEENP